MNNTYKRACTEILEILKYLPEEEYEKIPKEQIEFYEKNKDSNYEYIFDRKKILSGQGLSRTTKILIVSLFKEYFATSSQKEKLEQILIENYKKKNS